MRRYLVWALVVLALLLYLFGSQFISLLTDLYWFTDLGYRSVMLTVIRTQLSLAAVLGVLFFIIVYVNLWIARRWAPPIPRLYPEIGLGERIGQIARQSVDFLLLAGSLFVAILVAFEASSHWQQYLLWRHFIPFGRTDPLFHHDVGFYVFQLPFIRYLYRWLFFALLVAFFATGWVHYTDRALRFNQNIPIPLFAPHVKVHLSILLSLLLFVLAYGYWLRRFALLQSDFGLVSLTGAGYTDVHARLLGLEVMAIGSVIVGALMLFNLGLRGLTVPAIGLASLVGLSLVVGVLYPAFMQAYIVSPSDATLEQPYINNNIQFTRAAYQLDRIVPKRYSADTPPSAGELKRHQSTLDNIRLWDYKTLRRVYDQQQGLKPYYNFQDVDIDRYHFKSGYQQVLLSAREFNLDQAPQKTWIAQRLQYTHGYGAVMSSVNGISAEGSPVYLLKDMPPQPAPGLEGELSLKRPQIYFGAADNGFAIVNTDQPEFDYPASTGDKSNRYDGRGGVSIGSYLSKLLFGIRFGDANFVLSKLIGPTARVLFHRQVQDRIETLAPFLIQDQDPYLVVANGRLYWMLDCYTATDMYPYSEPFREGVNYLRNSVKVTVDAYDGTTNFYVFDRKDPIIQSYEQIFPDLFHSAEQLPKFLKSHIRYPEDLFDIQSRLYCQYHMSNPKLFYTQSDAWTLATEGTGQGDEQGAMQPYYVTMMLPDSDKLEFILIRPFTPVGKQNMSAWMAVRCDPDDYGRTIVYQFPETSLTQGPAQIQARIQQDPDISQRVSLWNQQGSHIVWGNLLVFPIEHSMLYVQALYLESEQGPAKMPELKQVIAAIDQPQRISMQPSLGEALSQVLGTSLSVGTGSGAPSGNETSPGGAAPVQRGPQTLAGLVRAANTQMDAAEKAQRSGDWAGYGKALGQLRQTLRRLQSPSGTPTSKTAVPASKTAAPAGSPLSVRPPTSPTKP